MYSCCVADRVDARLELLHPHLVEALADLGRVDRRVEDVALLAAGAADEDAADAFGRVLGDGARALGRFVVGVRVDREETERCVGGLTHDLRTYPPRPRSDARSIGIGRGGRAGDVDLDPADAADAAAAEPLEREAVVVLERVRQLGRHDDRLRAGRSRPAGARG